MLYSLKKMIAALFVCFLLVSWTNSEKPKLFLVGDSISIQYWPYLKEYLSGICDIDRKNDDGQAEKNLDVPVGANGGDSRMVLEYLRLKFSDPDFKPCYLLLNCGLHDIKHNPKTGVIQVTEEDYHKNLTDIIHLLNQNQVKLIWIRTTYVVDSIHNAKSSSMRRYGADVVRYNAIADKICEEHNIPSIDLYEFTKQLGVQHIADHVHYDESTKALQAAYIAGFVQEILTSQKK
jgi:lysophospholipase L1-like esterase